METTNCQDLPYRWGSGHLDSVGKKGTTSPLLLLDSTGMEIDPIKSARPGDNMEDEYMAKRSKRDPTASALDATLVGAQDEPHQAQ